jgi:hypothetical protein
MCSLFCHRAAEAHTVPVVDQLPTNGTAIKGVKCLLQSCGHCGKSGVLWSTSRASGDAWVHECKLRCRGVSRSRRVRSPFLDHQASRLRWRCDHCTTHKDPLCKHRTRCCRCQVFNPFSSLYDAPKFAMPDVKTGSNIIDLAVYTTATM